MKILSVFFTLLLAGSALAQWNHQTVDSMSLLYPSIAVNQSGRPAVCYIKGMIPGALWYAEHDGSSWQKASVEALSMWLYAAYPSICFDRRGWPHIAYYSSSPRYLRHAWRDGSGWHTEDVDQSPGTNYLFTSIVADTSNGIHIAYVINGGNRVCYAYHNGAAWVKDSLPVGASSNMVWIDVDAQNRPHIVTSGKLYYRNLGAGWLYDTLNYTSIMGTPVIRFDSQDHPHIVHYSTQLFHLWHTGASWQLDTAKSSACYTHFDLDGSDRCHIVHSDYNQPCSLAYTSNATGAWTTEVISTTKKVYGNGNFQIAVGPDGAVHVCEYDTIGSQGYLNYHWRAGAGVALPPMATPSGSPRPRLWSQPNPFSARTSIRFSSPGDRPAVIRIYDQSGRLIKTLDPGVRGMGMKSVAWDGTDQYGHPAPAGVYFCRLSEGGSNAIHKMVKIR